jgi:hypothetical protein
MLDSQAGDVTAGPGQARGPAKLDRIMAADADDRDSGCGLPGGLDGIGADGVDDIDPELDELVSESREAVGLSLRVSPLDDDVLPVGITELAKPIRERIDG